MPRRCGQASGSEDNDDGMGADDGGEASGYGSNSEWDEGEARDEADKWLGDRWIMDG